jgi:glycosyltransferase involved in cell wall biosynthesis
MNDKTSKIDWPSVSVVIPTLNAGSVLEQCLNDISTQDYPQEKIEIVIADGGSTDDTIKIAQKYGAKIYPNPLKTGEAGKAVGVKNANNELIALIDSDNFLPNESWFKQMVQPFLDNPEIIGSEPISYTYRKTDPLITRYSALLGMNDPLVLFTGNYDRHNYLTNKWTDVKHGEVDKGGYLEVTLDEKDLPTIGANGTFLKTKQLQKEVQKLDYLFDIDIIYELVKSGQNKFAKVKVGIIHVFCRNTGKFIIKQRRRIQDYLFYNSKNLRKYPWGGISKFKLVKFTLYSQLIIPTTLQAIIGYIKKPDSAWFFHPFACWITFWIYGWNKFMGIFTIKESNRQKWSQ